MVVRRGSLDDMVLSDAMISVAFPCVYLRCPREER